MFKNLIDIKLTPQQYREMMIEDCGEKFVLNLEKELGKRIDELKFDN